MNNSKGNGNGSGNFRLQLGRKKERGRKAAVFYTGPRLIKWPTSSKLNKYALPESERDTEAEKEREGAQPLFSIDNAAD